MDSGSYRIKYPNLFNFFAAYFHEDFGLEGTPDEIIQNYINDCLGCSGVHATLNEIRGLNNEGLEEAALEELVFRLGCAYYPPGDGSTYTGWLKHVEEVLQQHSA